jgi:hypothetical protein
MNKNENAETDPITDFIAQTFGKAFRTARRDRDFLANAGLLDDVAGGTGGRRQWSPWGVASFLIAECCGLPITDVAEHVPAIRDLPRLLAWCHDEQREAFDGFYFPHAKSFGQWLAMVIQDHRCGRFKRFREPGAPSLQLAITFRDDAQVVQTLAAITGTPITVIGRTFGLQAPRTFRAFAVDRELHGSITWDAPECGPTVFERIAEILGPQADA